MCAGFVSLKSWVQVHRVKVALAVLVCALLVSAAFASTFFRSSQVGPTVTVVSPPIELSMSMDKTVFQVGENITVRLHLRNISNQTIRLEESNAYYLNEYPYPMLLLGFAVTSDNGTEVFRLYDKAPRLYWNDHIDMKEGESLNYTYSWNQISDFPNYPRLNLRLPVPAGTYYIKGVIPLGPKGDGLNIDSGPWMSLETASIAITIG